MKGLNQFDFDGACKPSPGINYVGQRAFSVGIFQWIQTVDGKRLKKSAVIRRVKGYISDPEPVYEKAKKICKEMQKEWDHRK
jgi:hypothetical protein